MGEPPQIPSSGGAVPARPRLSGPWRPPNLGGVCHLCLSSTLWAPQCSRAWVPFLVTFLLCPLSSNLSPAGSSLPFPFLQGADSLPLSFFPRLLSLPGPVVCRVPTGRQISHFPGYFLWQQNWLPLAVGKRGLGVGWSGKGTWLWARGRPGVNGPRVLAQSRQMSGSLKEHLLHVTHCGLGSVEEKG